MKKIITYILFGITALCALLIIIYAVLNIELTQFQIMKNTWQLYLGVCTSLALTYFLSKH